MRPRWLTLVPLCTLAASGCSTEDALDEPVVAEGGADDGGSTTIPTADGGPGEGGGPGSGMNDRPGEGDDAPGDGTDDASADSEGEDGISFVLRPDGGGINECDPKIQDCDEGEKCTAWSNDGGTFWNANRCVEVGGTGVAGDSCVVEGGGVSGMDDCDVGHICLNTNEDNVGTCIKFCAGSDDDCTAGNVCAIYNDGVLPICLVGCDPLLQDCGELESCIDTPNQTFICFTDASGAAGAAGDACPSEHGENSCDPGNWCGPGAAGCQDVNCCTPFCDLDADDCNAPNVCVSFYGDPNSAPPGYAAVGVCVLP